jgi:hypothetical protein
MESCIITSSVAQTNSYNIYNKYFITLFSKCYSGVDISNKKKDKLMILVRAVDSNSTTGEICT